MAVYVKAYRLTPQATFNDSLTITPDDWPEDAGSYTIDKEDGFYISKVQIVKLGDQDTLDFSKKEFDLPDLELDDYILVIFQEKDYAVFSA